MSRPPAWGVVAIAALDVRRRPDHRAELLSQLLLGEVVRVVGRASAGAWLRVIKPDDGYRGWVRSWGLAGTTRAGAARWQARAKSRIATLFTEVRSRPGAGWLVSPLFWSSRVIAGSGRGRHREVRLPDGRKGWVPSAAFDPRRMPLIDRVQQLIGVPYLWGGRTPAGLDCSAFAQLLLAEQGIVLPRDTAEQVRAFPRLRREESPAAGDLIFFRSRSGRVGHVGVGLGEGYFAHCRGTVRISTLDSSNTLFDKELSGTETGWFRPRSGRRTRRPSGE